VPSPQHHLLTRVISVLRGRAEVQDPEQVRRDVLAAQTRHDPAPPRRIMRRFEVRELDSFGVPAYELEAPGSQPVRTVLYLHGGGFVSGLDRFHWRYAARLASRLGVRVVLPRYGLTPVHTWADALPPLVEMFEVLAVDSPRGVVVMGDSAGGGLAVGLAQAVAARPGPQPTHLVAFAPWLDLTGETPGTLDAAASDPWLTLGKRKLYGTWWGAGDPPAAAASPLSGDLAGLPPTLIAVAGVDVLRSDGEAYAAALEAAGVEVALELYEDMTHGFLRWGGVVDRARELVERCAGFAAGRLTG
jgi:epsilon-lactone hydrolase